MLILSLTTNKTFLKYLSQTNRTQKLKLNYAHHSVELKLKQKIILIATS